MGVGAVYQGSGVGGTADGAVGGVAGGVMGCLPDEMKAMIAATNASQKPKLR